MLRFLRPAAFVVLAPPHDGWTDGWLTFDGALEQLREDAVGRQLVEHAAQELLGHPRCVAGNHHAGVERGRKRQGIVEQAA